MKKKIEEKIQKKRNHKKKKKKSEETPKEPQLNPKDVQETITRMLNKIREEKDKVPDTIWRNKQRVLVICSRGASTVDRKIISDLRSLMPHSKSEPKLDINKDMSVINEIAELRGCNNCIFIDAKSQSEVIFWVVKAPNGPSVKFQMFNPKPSGNFEFIGNCLLGSRPIVTFDAHFESTPYWKLIKELLSQVFSTPKGHPNSKPFVDHTISFFIQENRIWFRSYQFAPKTNENRGTTELVEIGPRFTLEPIKIYEGSFGGPIIYTNKSHIPHKQKKVKKPKKTFIELALDKGRQAAKIEKRVSSSREDPLMSVFKDDE